MFAARKISVDIFQLPEYQTKSRSKHLQVATAAPQFSLYPPWHLPLVTLSYFVFRHTFVDLPSLLHLCSFALSSFCSHLLAAPAARSKSSGPGIKINDAVCVLNRCRHRSTGYCSCQSRLNVQERTTGAVHRRWMWGSGDVTIDSSILVARVLDKGETLHKDECETVARRQEEFALVNCTARIGRDFCLLFCLFTASMEGPAGVKSSVLPL